MKIVTRRGLLKTSGAAMLLPALGHVSPLNAASKEISLDSNLVSVGNSLTDQSIDMVHFFTANYGRGRGTLGHQSIPGAPMNWNWDHAGSADPNGKRLLKSGQQDIWMGVESVPFRHVQSPGDACDITAWKKWYRLAIDNGVSRFFLFEAWHDLNSGRASYQPEDRADPDTGIAWRERIDFARPYWTGIVDYVNGQKRAGEPTMLMIPGGTMFGQIHDDIRSGRAPSSIGNIQDLFFDSIHPNVKGRYAMACIMYACLYRRSPVGLPVQTTNIHGGAFPRMNPKEAAYFQKLAWKIAKREPHMDI